MPADVTRFYTDRGHPVPYVADWSSEAAEFPMFDPEIGRFAIFTAGYRGVGSPVLGKMNPARQRDCMMHYRCQVCYEPVRPPLFAAHWPGQTAADPRSRKACPLLLEPWACAACLRAAFRVCPGLARREARPVRVSRHLLVVTLCRPVGDVAKAKGLPADGVVSYVKALVLEHEDAPEVTS